MDKFRQNFDKLSRPDWNPLKKWTNLGFRSFLNAVRGKRVRNPKGWIQGEAKRRKGVGDGDKKERGRTMGKGWEERGPKAHSETSDFGTPVICSLHSQSPTGLLLFQHLIR